MRNYLILFYILFLLTGCTGDPVTNKIVMILYVIPLGIAAYLIGALITSAVSLFGTSGDSKDNEGVIIKRIVIGGLVMFLIYNIFN